MLNIVNNRYNKLVAVKFIETVKKHSYWLFKCDCGKEKVLRVDSVLSGKTKSCGCIMKETISIEEMNELCKDTCFSKV